MAAPTPAVTLTHYSLKIHFGSVLHLRIPRADLVGVQSWRDGPRHFSIEYHLRGGASIKTEYDTPEKWTAILAGLDEVLP
jgi:hypothetical protein